MPAGNVTLTATCTINSYKFDLNGVVNGSGAGNIGSNKVNVYVNGSKVDSNVSDSYRDVQYGATVKVEIVSVATGNWYQGTTSGGAWIDG